LDVGEVLDTLEFADDLEEVEPLETTESLVLGLEDTLDAPVTGLEEVEPTF